MDAKNDKAAKPSHDARVSAGDNGEAVTHVSQVESVADLLAKFALTDAEVGRLLGVPASTVGNLHRTGALRAVKIGGRLAWRPADVQRFVEALHEEN